MRAIDRDLIRGGHYGQRSCEPHQQAEHMAAPTKRCDVKIPLANPEPSENAGLADIRIAPYSQHITASDRRSWPHDPQPPKLEVSPAQRGHSRPVSWPQH